MQTNELNEIVHIFVVLFSTCSTYSQLRHILVYIGSFLLGFQLNLPPVNVAVLLKINVNIMKLDLNLQPNLCACDDRVHKID